MNVFILGIPIENESNDTKGAAPGKAEQSAPGSSSSSSMPQCIFPLNYVGMYFSSKL